MAVKNNHSAFKGKGRVLGDESKAEDHSEVENAFTAPNDELDEKDEVYNGDEEEVAHEAQELLGNEDLKNAEKPEGEESEAEEDEDTTELDDEDYEVIGPDGSKLTVTLSRVPDKVSQAKEDKLRSAILQTDKARINEEKAAARFELVIDRANASVSLNDPTLVSATQYDKLSDVPKDRAALVPCSNGVWIETNVGGKRKCRQMSAEELGSVGFANNCQCPICTKQQEFQGYYKERLAMEAGRTRSNKKFRSGEGHRLGNAE